MLVMLAAAPATYAMTPDLPEQRSFCSTLDPLDAYPIEQCMNQLPGDGLAGSDDDALLQRLIKLQAEGKSPAALRELDEQIIRRPLSPSLYFIRGVLLQIDNRQFDAIVEFNRALSLEPGMLDALLQRGWARARMNDLLGAIADTDRALAMAPGYPPAMMNKSLLLIGSGSSDEGMSMLGDLIRQSDRAGELLLIRAQLLIAQGETDEAMADLTRAVALLPANPQGYLLRAYILMARQESAPAIADLDKAITLGSPEPDLLLWRASLKQRLGDNAGAQQDFQAYAVKNPLRAADVLRQARITLKPDAGRVTALGYELHEKFLRNDVEGAEKTADELLQLTPENSELFVFKAIAALRRGDCDQGAAYLEKLPAKLQNSAAALGDHAVCLMDQGKSVEALALTTRMLEIMPNEPSALRLRGMAFLQSDRHGEALGVANELISQGEMTAYDQTLRISALHYLRRRDEAARLAIDFIRLHGSDDPQIIHVVPGIVFSLQREPTWPLAIELLDIFKPPPTKQDIFSYLAAREQMHRGETAKALATLMRIKSTHNSLATVDGEFRALWNNAEFKATFDPLTSDRKSFELFYRQHAAAPESLAETVNAIAHLRMLGCRRQALDEALRLLKTAPRYEEWHGAGNDAYMLVGDLQIDQGDLDGAAKIYDEGLIRLPGLQTTELLLDYADLLVATGQYAKAVILSDLALQRGITPFGKVIAHRIRAFAFDGLDDAKGRTEALDYLETHWRDNLVAALEPLGMLRSYDRLLAIIGEAAEDPERGRYLLMSLNKVTGIPARTEFDRRIEAFLERLKSDPKALEAVNRIGRIKPLAYQATCALSEKELAERPFQYPFETAPVTGKPATRN